jgi:type IV pilus assembly protein PilQ
MLNVRLVEVSLNNNETLGVTLGGTSGNFALNGVGGSPGGAPNNGFGGTPIDQPAGSSVDTIGSTSPGEGTITFNTLNRLQQALAVRVDAAIRSGSGKVLADPKIVVADGGSSRLDIGTQVVTRLVPGTPTSDNPNPQPIIELGTAGVVLDVKQVSIDDNGFITLNIEPSVNSPADERTFPGNITLTLLNQRTLSSQLLRLRDGQTFVLSGLIQDEDRVSATKVPLLGDIPLLGSLFRSQTATTERTEVVVMVTPYVLRDDVANGLPPVSTLP